ncbi:MAG TPA: hypothetical protein VGI46_20740 [Candidatus Acidoferrum sp.]|jgi:hypothetical protein
MPIDLTRLKSRTSVASGGVDITGFPQLLLTREFGDPDTLLIPLVDAAREAITASKGLAASNGDVDQVGMMAAIHVATAFMKDSNFTLAPKSSQPQSRYVLDLDAETIHLRTWLYATVGKRTSTFLVTIAGNIKTGMFAVRTGTEDNIVAEFDEKRLRQPGFFSTVLPEECLRLQMGMDHFKRFGNLPVAEVDAGVRLNLPLTSGPIPILLRRKDSADAWEVLDERTTALLVMLPPEAAVHIERLLAALLKILNK